jgi:hypothetical protein
MNMNTPAIKIIIACTVLFTITIVSVTVLFFYFDTQRKYNDLQTQQNTTKLRNQISDTQIMPTTSQTAIVPTSVITSTPIPQNKAKMWSMFPTVQLIDASSVKTTRYDDPSKRFTLRYIDDWKISSRTYQEEKGKYSEAHLTKNGFELVIWTEEYSTEYTQGAGGGMIRADDPNLNDYAFIKNNRGNMLLRQPPEGAPHSNSLTISWYYPENDSPDGNEYIGRYIQRLEKNNRYYSIYASLPENFDPKSNPALFQQMLKEMDFMVGNFEVY